MEASLIKNLNHPNLVRTIETGKAFREGLCSMGSGGMSGGSLGSGGSMKCSGGSVGPGSPGRDLRGSGHSDAETARINALQQEMWLLLEYCDMGSLQVCSPHYMCPRKPVLVNACRA